LHAGDFISLDVFRKLSQWTKVYGVCGNMDNRDLCEQLPLKQIIKLENIQVGLIHGRGSPSNLLNYIKNEFSQELEALDIVVFGHSHYPSDKEVNDVVYFNPGSPTDTMFAPHRSYGIFEIEGESIKRRIIKIE
jgi:putative phosphoesterase